MHATQERSATSKARARCALLVCIIGPLLACSSEPAIADRPKQERIGRASSRLLAESGSVDSSDAQTPGDEVVLKTGVGYYISEHYWNEFPGFCFFTSIRGGFKDQGDYAVIRKSGAPDFVWEIAVRSERGDVLEAPGPKVEYGCVLWTQFSHYSLGSHSMGAEYYQATAGGPSTAATGYHPDASLDPPDPEIAPDGVFVLSKVHGALGPTVRGQACTTGAFSGIGNAAQVEKYYYSASGCAYSDPDGACSLTIGAFNHYSDPLAVSPIAFSYDLQDVNKEAHIRTMLAGNQTPDPDLQLTDSDDSVCFISGLASDMSTSSDDVTIAASNGYWHLVSTLNGPVFGSATCLSLAQ